MAMLKKNYILKKRMKGSLVYEILFPVLYGWLTKYAAKKFHCEDCSPEVYNIGYAIIPFILCLLIPNLTGIASRFLIQTIVDDKQTKMRETLRIMSLTQMSYGVSFFLLQGIFAVLGGVIFLLFVYNDSNIFPVDAKTSSVQFALMIMLHNIAQIPFSMALSTFFNDPRVAAYMG